jgi:hypothetical protein
LDLEPSELRINSVSGGMMFAIKALGIASVRK